MITLAELAALHEAYADALAAPITPVTIGGVTIGQVSLDQGPITIMGAINLSRDSTYRESVAVSADAAIRMSRVQTAQGARLIDLGAESSTAKAQRVGPAEQLAQLVPVIKTISSETVVSVETYVPEVVIGCLDAGAQVLNMTGRQHEDEMLRLAAEREAAVIMCFGESTNVREIGDVPLEADPMPALLDHFGPRLEAAYAVGVSKVIIDPGMGFYYGNLTDPLTRARHQAKVLAQTFRLRTLGAPICNVLPHTYDIFEDEFRKAEGFYAVLAALGGTNLLRIHEIPHVRTVLSAMRALSVS